MDAGPGSYPGPRISMPEPDEVRGGGVLRRHDHRVVPLIHEVFGGIESHAVKLLHGMGYEGEAMRLQREWGQAVEATAKEAAAASRTLPENLTHTEWKQTKAAMHKFNTGAPHEAQPSGTVHTYK